MAWDRVKEEEDAIVVVGLVAERPRVREGEREEKRLGFGRDRF